MSNSKEQVKEEIVTGAGEIFSRFGYRKTTVAEIAQRVNKAKSSIFHYFNSKEEIFLAVLKKEGRELSRLFNEIIEKEKTPQLKLRAYFLTRVEVMASIVNFYQALNDVELEHLDFIKNLRRFHIERERDRVADILKEGIDLGIFEIEDVTLSAGSIVTAFKGFESVYHDQRQAFETNHQISPEMEKQIDCLLRIIFKGIEKKRNGLALF